MITREDIYLLEMLVDHSEWYTRHRGISTLSKGELERCKGVLNKLREDLAMREVNTKLAKSRDLHSHE